MKKIKRAVEYHCYDSCNKCGGLNSYDITDTVDGHISECETSCVNCGFEDYWAHGFFESGESMESNCKKYSFKGVD